MNTEIQTTQSNNSVPQKKKFRIKMPSAMAIIIGIVVFVALLSLIPHGAGMATEITIGSGDDAITYQAGSLGAWQNWIIYNELGETDKFSTGVWASSYKAEDVEDIIDKFGLEGYWMDGVGFITETSLPFTISGYSDGTTSMFGLLDVPKALLGGYLQALDVAFYIVGIYALVLILMETHTLKNGVTSLVKGLGGREIILIPTLFVLFSLGGTLFGMQEETLGLIPIIIPVLIIAGFDAPAGILVVVLGTTTGIAASVLDPFSVAVMAEGLGAGIGTAILERLVLFIIYTTIGALFVTWYAARVRKNPEKSYDKDRIEENKVWAEEKIGDIEDLETMTGAQKWSLAIFGLIFAWMIFSLMPWLDWFEGLETSEGWKIFSSIFYGHVLLGKWYFVELGILFILGAFLIGGILGMESNKIMKTFWQSTKEMFGVITIISFSRATAMVLSSTGLTYGMIYGMIGNDTSKLKEMNVVLFMLIWLMIFTVMAFFIPSTSGLAGITSPIIGGVTTVAGGVDDPHAKLMIVSILMVYPLAQGVVNMFSPTTGLVIVQSETGNVNYGKILPLLAGYAATIFIVGALVSSVIIGVEASILL